MKICLIHISRGNKAGNRPHYYCFEDNTTGIYWMIPLSSRIDKFRKIIEKKEQAGKPCDILHIVKLDDSRESVFLIQDMFPITEEYIEREYTIAGNHLMLTSEHTAKVIEQKARKVLGMLKRGVKFMPTHHADTAGCTINIGAIKAEKIVLSGSILALIIWYEKNIR